MRYQDWDVLLFPSTENDSRVPVKEFKVACHVVPETEFASATPAAFGLPVMTCFVPALPAGTPFHISIHSWATPEISQFTKAYSKHPELAKYEARILIDGRLVASISFNRVGSWPQMVSNMYDITKNGDLEPLRFPAFRRELLHQNHWNAGDDIGRVKIIISEGFPRDSPSAPIERVKNVVAFSFQHAPLDILENNGIAWPNPRMWRRAPANPSMPVPTYHPDEGSDSHAHSPRRRSMLGRNAYGDQSMPLSLLSGLPTPSLIPSAGFPQPFSLAQRSANSTASNFLDPFGEASYMEWASSLGMGQTEGQGGFGIKPGWPTFAPRNMSRHSGTDTSMTDYLPSSITNSILSDAMQIAGGGLDGDIEGGHLKVPTNTPTAGDGEGPSPAAMFPLDIPNSAISGELATSLTQSLLNQPHPLPVQAHQVPLPASEIKSRKENRQFASTSKGVNGSPVSIASPSGEAQARKSTHSQPSSMFSVVSGDARASSGSSAPVFSRQVSSAAEFGVNITNLADPAGGNAASPGRSALSTIAEKGTKRSRTLTQGSGRASEEEHEPKRVSPQLRLKTFGLDGDGGIGE